MQRDLALISLHLSPHKRVQWFLLGRMFGCKLFALILKRLWFGSALILIFVHILVLVANGVY
jgi:hypothetical protein